MPKFYRKKKAYSRRRMSKKRTSRVKSRRRRTRRRKAPLRKKVMRLSRRVAKVSRALSNTTGIKWYRENFSQTFTVPTANTQVYEHYNMNTIQGIERALAGLNFFDPTAPATPIVADGNTGEYRRTYQMSGTFFATFRNNFQTTMEFWTYMCVPKLQTTVSPEQCVLNGLIDMGVPVATTMLTAPNDSAEFRMMYKIVKSQHRILGPGQSVTCRHSSRWTYDPSFNDTFNKTYYPQYGSCVILVRGTGGIVHTPGAPTVIGLGLAQLDVYTEHRYKIIYDAGYSARFITVTNNLDAITAAAVSTNKPVADNQIFDPT